MATRTARRIRRFRAQRLIWALLPTAIIFLGWLLAALYLPVGGNAVTRFTVSRGASLPQVARELKARGLIRSAWAFRIAAAWGDGWRHAVAGDYALRGNMSAVQILRAFQRGDVIAEWITIPEGLTVWQVAALVEAAGLGTAAEFQQAADSRLDLQVAFPLPSGSLEGYLFPDTYRVARRPGAARELVGRMVGRFEEVVWRGILGGRPPNSSLHELITLASLVEGEAKLNAERPLIAGVLVNRLRQGRRLECDATVQYALGSGRKERLTYADLALPSPYNTYLHPGLPPGPINSPGKASIAAALKPAPVPYLYYVARPNGSHIFSRTYAEHLRAVARLRAQRAATNSRSLQPTP